jgi:hypothetical protein
MYNAHDNRSLEGFIVEDSGLEGCETVVEDEGTTFV